ncbi:MAG: ComF family protein [Anaerolineae bacterium]
MESLVQTSHKRFAVWRDAFLDLLFPPHCVVCHRLGSWLCPDCQGRIELILPPLCLQCGLPLEKLSGPSYTPGACKFCHGKTTELDGLRAYGFHTDPLRKIIHEFKYRDLQGLAKPLGQMMAQGWSELAPSDWEVDVIVPVPLHPTRQRQRGYNQSALLARELGFHIRRPVVENAFFRSKPTLPQVELNFQERMANIQGAFQCVDSALAGKRVLLVDDVCTTGATLEAASAALRRGKVSSIWAYTLARAKPE